MNCLEPFCACLSFCSFFHFFFFDILKQDPIYFSCLGECCNAVSDVKSHEYIVDYKTAPGFPSAWG